MIAASFLEPTALQFAVFIGCVLAALAMYVLFMAAVRGHRETWGPHPTMPQELKDLRKELEKFAPKETVDKIVAQLGSYVTDGRLQEVLKALKQDEKQLREDFHGDITQLRVDVRHDVRGELNAAGLEKFNFEERLREESQGLHERITTLAEAQGGLVGEVGEINKNVRLLLERSLR